MAATNEQTWKYAQAAEKELHASLAEKDPALRNIDLLVAQYRSKCEDSILQDFEFALSKSVEQRLWDAHIKINSRFRKQLAAFRDAAGKRKLVEKRKTVKHYLDFIKSSQRFYRGYIQKLASRFGGIRELEAVAQKFSLATQSVTSQESTSRELRNTVLRSCHQTLVRLGDLSRYRETEISTKEHNWGPAIGYYDLAGAIFPASGASHNQLAVIARTDANHLRAIYHLYRALAVEEPYPGAKGNLEIEFRKIRTAWDKGELVANSLHRDSPGPGKALVGWFMRLHALCYAGVDFVEHDELENEVLSQLAIDLKERSLEGTLNRFIITNVAAEYFAAIRLRDAPESPEIWQSFFFFQRLNVKTMFTLLQVLQPELERQVDAGGESDIDGTPTPGPNQISVVARRVLPGLRHYSSWLISNAKVLTTQFGDALLSVQIKELWKIYASTLTLLASTFEVSDLPSIDYLLEEDEDTLGFKPFENGRTTRRYCCQESDNQKPKWHNNGVERHHPNLEMFGRIRDFLTDGLLLAVDESIPIDLVAGTHTFTYREEGMPSEIQASPECSKALKSTMIEPGDISYARRSSPHDGTSRVDEEASQATSVSVSLNTEAHRMVDNLVESEAAEADQTGEEMTSGDFASGMTSGDFASGSVAYVNPSPLGPPFEIRSSAKIAEDTTYGFHDSADASEFMRALHGFSHQDPRNGSPRPFLPSIYNSPFAPQAGEATPGSRPSTAKRMSPRHSQHSSQHKIPLLQQPPTGLVVDSSIGSTDWSSLGFSQTPKMNGNNQLNLSREVNYYGAIGGPVLGNDRSAVFDDSEFRSSEVFKGSTWACSGQSASQGPSLQTPPSGQGAR